MTEYIPRDVPGRPDMAYRLNTEVHQLIASAFPRITVPLDLRPNPCSDLIEPVALTQEEPQE